MMRLCTLLYIASCQNFNNEKCSELCKQVDFQIPMTKADEVRRCDCVLLR